MAESVWGPPTDSPIQTVPAEISSLLADLHLPKGAFNDDLSTRVCSPAQLGARGAVRDASTRCRRHHLAVLDLPVAMRTSTSWSSEVAVPPSRAPSPQSPGSPVHLFPAAHTARRQRPPLADAPPPPGPRWCPSASHWLRAQVRRHGAERRASAASAQARPQSQDAPPGQVVMASHTFVEHEVLMLPAPAGLARPPAAPLGSRGSPSSGPPDRGR